MTSELFDNIQSEQITLHLNEALSDSILDYNDALNILTQTASNGFSEIEITDLKNMFSTAFDENLFESDYVRYITQAVIYSNPANQLWWGGTKTADQAVSVGNAQANMSEQSATRLIGEWFLGTDLPMPIAGGDTATGKAAQSSFDYAQATGPLFVSGTSETDVSQGQAGTCYVVASFGALAAKDGAIESLFIDNGNDTYGVRFFIDDEIMFTTVSTSLPVTSWNRIAFTGNNSKSLSGELWPSLIEKAFVQMNGQYNIAGRDDWTGEVSYQAVEGGWASPLKFFTGLEYDYYGQWSMNDGTNRDSFVSYSFAGEFKQGVIDALDAGGIGWLGSWDSIYDDSGALTIVGGHAHEILGYNANDDTFTIRNPWGGSNTSNYKVEFDVDLDSLWYSKSLLIAVTDPIGTSNQPQEYTYTLSNNASSQPVMEGQNIRFTINRDQAGTSDTIYISTIADTASEADFEAKTFIPITFSSSATSHFVDIATFADNFSDEGTEAFSLALYKTLQDTTAIATSEANIADANVAINYALNANSTLTSPVVEGSDVIATITRSDLSGPSTIYMSTSTLGHSADEDDFSAKNFIKVDFDGKQTSTNVKIATYQDLMIEGTESFQIKLFPSVNATDALAEATAWIMDATPTEYEYAITSSADTIGKAAEEGTEITFTVHRMGSGTVSSVYLKPIFTTAASSDLKNATERLITFDANKQAISFTVDVAEDTWLETVESFDYNLYRTATSENVETYATAFIADAKFVAANYELSTDATLSNPATEGDDITFSINRYFPEGHEPTSSTVYAEIVGITADENDVHLSQRFAISFSSKEIEKVVSVETFVDNNDEEIETIALNLFQKSSDEFASTSITAFLQDPEKDDSNEFSYKISDDTRDFTLDEGDSATVTIERVGSASVTSSVYVSTTMSSADSDDFQEIALQEIQFAPYETQKHVQVSTYHDNVEEDGEVFWLDLFLTKPDGQAGHYHDFATFTIQDVAPQDDTDVIYKMLLESDIVTEGDPVTVTISRSARGVAQNLYIITSPSTAHADDFEIHDPLIVSFGAQDLSKTVTIETFSDDREEFSENFYIDLYTSSNAQPSQLKDYKLITIQDDTTKKSTYSYLVTDPQAVAEGDTITFTITREGDLGKSSTIFVSTTHGNTSANDFVGMNAEKFTFARNQESLAISIETYADNTIEADEEYFWLDVFQTKADAVAGNYIAFGTGTLLPETEDQTFQPAQFDIVEDDISAIEGDHITMTVRRDTDIGSAKVYLSTTLSTADSADLETVTNLPIIFSPGELEKTVSLETFLDSEIEGDEFLWVDLFDTYENAQNLNYTDFVAVTIQDRSEVVADITYSLPQSEFQAAEGETLAIEIMRDTTEGESTIYVSTSHLDTGDEDFVALSQQAISFQDGSSIATASIDILQDGIDDDGEIFWLDLYQTKADAQTGTWFDYATIEIVQDNIDTYEPTSYSYVITDEITVTEGDDAIVTITRNSSSGASTIFARTSSTTATEDEDYEALSPIALNFQDGETEIQLSVPVWNDDLTESDEYFFIDLYETEASAIEGIDYTSYATITILDQKNTNETGQFSVSGPEANFYAYEGDHAEFIIQRSASTTSETIWYNIDFGSAGLFDVEWAGIPQSVTFDIGDIEKTISIPIIDDWFSDPEEYFWFAIYNSFYDALLGSQMIDESYAYIAEAPNSPQARIQSPSLNNLLMAEGASGQEMSTSGPTNTSKLQQSLPTNNELSHAYPGHDFSTYRNASAFAAITTDGSVVAWGNKAAGGDVSDVKEALKDVQKIVANNQAFAAILADGSVVAWGDPNLGGFLGDAANNLDGSIAAVDIASSKFAFAALLENGTVITWGDPERGGSNPHLDDIVIEKITSNTSAFAAIDTDGVIRAWGSSTDGGVFDSNLQQMDVAAVDIFATTLAFAALFEDGTIATWGNAENGGDASSVADALQATDARVIAISATESAFAALYENGEILTWGNAQKGGDSSAIAHKLSTSTITEIFSTSGAFAALCEDGSVLTWGDPVFGGESQHLADRLDGSNKVVDIVANRGAFVAIHEDGMLTSWGVDGFGADSLSVKGLLKGSDATIVDAMATDRGFALLMSDAKLITWGDFGDDYNTDIISVMSETTDVEDIFASDAAFAALVSPEKWEGHAPISYAGSQEAVADFNFKVEYSEPGKNVVTWGHSEFGGSLDTQSLAAIDITGNKPSIFYEASIESTNITSTSSALDFSALSKGSKTSITLDSDINASKAISVSDVIATLKHAVGITELDAWAQIAADVDQDQNIGVSDVISILKKAVGIDSNIESHVLAKTEDGYKNEFFLIDDISLELVILGDVDGSWLPEIA